jgi:hypothetical protein
MECPRCRLINPDTAVRCDCGYDFESKTVEKAYFAQKLPKEIRAYLVVLLVLNGIGVLGCVASGDAIRMLTTAVWMAVVYWCYSNLVRKNNWARIALIVLTFPIGLWLLGSEARLYCLQSKN